MDINRMEYLEVDILPSNYEQYFRDYARFQAYDRLKREKRNLSHSLYQKAAGIFLIALSILCGITVKDCTPAFLLLPIGIFAVFTKKKIIVMG